MIKRAIAIMLILILCVNVTACAGNSSSDDSDRRKESSKEDTDDSLKDEDVDKKFEEYNSDAEIPAERDEIDYNNDGKVSLEEFDIELAAGKCKKCQECIQLYYNLISKADEYSHKDSIDRSDMELFVNEYLALHEALDHKCKAEKIYVESVPFAYYYSLGSYTGEWQGVGPTGNGTYLGNAFVHDTVVKYDGEWVWGLPEGKGYLFYGNFKGYGWDMSYSGDMMCGKRHGKGTMFEYRDHDYIEAFHNYRYYEEATWENDTMTSKTRFENYNADTNELVSYGVMTGSKYGWVDMLESHDPKDKLSATDVALLVAGFAVTYIIIDGLFDTMIDTSYTPMTPEEMSRVCNEYQERKEKEYQERQIAENKKQAQYCQDKYQEQKDWPADKRNSNFTYWENNRYYDVTTNKFYNSDKNNY